MSYLTLALFPMCYILSLSLLHAFASLAPTSSLYLFARCLHYPFALVHVHFLHSAHHITTSIPTKLHILRYVPIMVGRGWSIVLFLLLVTQCLLVFIFFEVIKVWLIVVPLFIALDLLPCYSYCQPSSIELSEMVSGIVICACYHLWPEPSFHELSHQAMLIVEATIIHNHPVSFFDLSRA